MMGRVMRVLVLAVMLTPAVLWAAAEVRPDHPESYTVKSGDTLWDISGRFLKNPWAWPEIWQANPEIKNPDLIYPGDVLELVYVDGKPRIVRKGQGRKSSSGTRVKLSPRVRTEQAIPPIPIEAIKPFLTHPRVVDAEAIRTAPHIVGFPDGNLVGGEGMRAYAHGMKGHNAARYDIMRRGRTYFDYDTGEELGYLARYVGTATLSRSGDPATLRLDTTDIEVSRGDRLMPVREPYEPGWFFPSTPEGKVNGTILDAYETIGYVGRFQVVLIDRGSDDGLVPGNTLLIDNRGRIIRDYFGPLEEQRVFDDIGGTFRQSIIPPEIQLPDESAGALIVFDVFDRMSLGLVMISDRVIRTGDKVRNP